MTGLQLADAAVGQVGSDSLLLRFPQIRPNNDVELLRLDFSTALFSTGAVLRASLQNSGREVWAWQRVDAGNAFSMAEGNTTPLVGAVGNMQLLREVSVQPPAFSPNGDGINDEAVFVFTVVRVSDDSPAEVEVYDLSGQRVRKLVEERAVSTGQRALVWDGRNDMGGVVPPGIYFARLRVATEVDGAGIDNAEVLRTISVAY